MSNAVLIVEDEPNMLKVFTRALSGAGYEVVVAQSAEEALEMVQDAAIQVGLLDIALPGINGLDLCKLLKQKNPIMCLFATTGQHSIFELTDCREAGFDDYFPKPVEMESLLTEVGNAFKRLERWRKIGK